MPNLEGHVLVIRGVGQIKILPIAHDARVGMVATENLMDDAFFDERLGIGQYAHTRDEGDKWEKALYVWIGFFRLSIPEEICNLDLSSGLSELL